MALKDTNMRRGFEDGETGVKVTNNILVIVYNWDAPPSTVNSAPVV
jgi:hypothetical protein